jgi:hypothetical protein
MRAGCVFMYIARQGNVAYSLTVSKVGYAPSTVTGVASPQAHVRIQLAPDTSGRVSGR